jgi:hypothetical protein
MFLNIPFLALDVLLGNTFRAYKWLSTSCSNGRGDTALHGRDVRKTLDL